MLIQAACILFIFAAVVSRHALIWRRVQSAFSGLRKSLIMDPRWGRRLLCFCPE